MATTTTSAGEKSTGKSTDNAKPHTQPRQDVQIHPSGNIYLCTTSKRFQVYCPTLRLASPVFHRMLDPTSPFLEGHKIKLALSSRKSPCEVNLEEDDSDALEIILNIAHHRGEVVPKWLEPERMFDVATLCDKYDMSSALRGWACLWTDKITMEDVKGKDAIRWLAVAWAFKNDVLVEDVTEYLIKNIKYEITVDDATTSGSDGVDLSKLSWASSDGTELLTDGIPSKVLVALNTSIRFLHLSLHKIAYTHALALLETTTTKCKHNVPGCDRLQLGTLLRLMSSAGIPTLRPSDEGDPPEVKLLSADEIHVIFSKPENTSASVILPRGRVISTGRASGVGVNAGSVRNNTINGGYATRPRQSLGGDRAYQKEREKEIQHSDCSVTRRVRDGMTKVLAEVGGLRGLL